MMRKVMVMLALAGFAFALLPLAFTAGVVTEPGALASAYLQDSPKDFAAANVVTAIVTAALTRWARWRCCSPPRPASERC